MNTPSELSAFSTPPSPYPPSPRQPKPEAMAMPEGYQAMDRDPPHPSSERFFESLACCDHMSMFFPCFAIARFTTRSRLGYAFVFLTVLIAYAGGISCFIMASRVPDPVLTNGGDQYDITTVVAFAWGTYIGGPWSTVVFDLLVWFGWALHEGLSERDPEDEYYAGRTSVILLIAHLVVQLVLTIAIIALIFKLRVRKITSCIAAFCWFFSCCCCPSCTLACAIATAETTQAASRDELPAYRV